MPPQVRATPILAEAGNTVISTLSDPPRPERSPPEHVESATRHGGLGTGWAGGGGGPEVGGGGAGLWPQPKLSWYPLPHACWQGGYPFQPKKSRERGSESPHTLPGQEVEELNEQS